MDFDVGVKLAVYGAFAETGRAPGPGEVAARIGARREAVLESWARLRAQRLLVLEAGGDRIRMAPPFSGVPTLHVVESGGVRYFGNCAWDALGIPAALRRPAVVRSRCARSAEPLALEIGRAGPPPSDWLFHCLVPATRWWDDIVFT